MLRSCSRPVDAGHPLHNARGLRFEAAIIAIARERHRAAIDAKRKEIENAIVGQPQQLLLHLERRLPACPVLGSGRSRCE